MSVKVVNKLPRFTKSLYNVLDDAVREGARDTLINAKTKAPFKQGQLRADSSVKQTKPLRWRVSFFKEYARFQEFGGDATRKIRKYTTMGTGSHFLRSAGDAQVKRIKDVYKKHARRAKA